MDNLISETTGRIASLHVHPLEPGQPLLAVPSLSLVAGQGVAEDKRYFDRRNRSGKPGRRQVSLIAREQIAEHAATLGLESLDPGRVRSNVETVGIDLGALVGRHVTIGEAVLYFYEPRTPCGKMDAICEGLRALMSDGRQGVMATVVRSGRISVGDPIRPVAPSDLEPSLRQGDGA